MKITNNFSMFKAHSRRTLKYLALGIFGFLILTLQTQVSNAQSDLEQEDPYKKLLDSKPLVSNVHTHLTEAEQQDRLNDPYILVIDKSFYDNLGEELANDYVKLIHEAVQIWEDAIGINLFEVFTYRELQNVSFLTDDRKNEYTQSALSYNDEDGIAVLKESRKDDDLIDIVWNPHNSRNEIAVTYFKSNIIDDPNNIEILASAIEVTGSGYSDAESMLSYAKLMDDIEKFAQFEAKPDAVSWTTIPSEIAAERMRIQELQAALLSNDLPEPVRQSARASEGNTRNDPGSLVFFECCQGGAVEMISKQMFNEVVQNIDTMEIPYTFDSFFGMYHVMGYEPGFSFLGTMVHELGHVLGFEHNKASSSVMNNLDILKQIPLDVEISTNFYSFMDIMNDYGLGLINFQTRELHNIDVERFFSLKQHIRTINIDYYLRTTIDELFSELRKKLQTSRD